MTRDRSKLDCLRLRRPETAAHRVCETASGGRALALFVLLSLLFVIVGCRRNDMAQQDRKDPLEPSTFYADGASARPLVPGTVPHDGPLPSQLHYATTQGSPELTVFPFPLTRADLKRGQERFDIYCAVCHGRAGDGDGMVVRRGFTKPPSFHDQKLKDAPPGHFFNVMTYGFGAMYNYADRVSPEDRWRIAGYIRALQLSRSIKLAELPESDRAQLQAAPTTQATTQSTTQAIQPETPPR